MMIVILNSGFDYCDHVVIAHAYLSTIHMFNSENARGWQVSETLLGMSFYLGNEPPVAFEGTVLHFPLKDGQFMEADVHKSFEVHKYFSYTVSP